MSKANIATAKKVIKTLSVILKDSGIKPKYLDRVLEVVNDEITLDKIVFEIKKQKNNKRKSSGPMKPRSAYIFFCKEKRAGIITENPGMKLTEVTSTLAEKWRKIKSTPEAEKYNNLASEDKIRYNNDMEAIEPRAERETRIATEKAEKERIKAEKKAEKERIKAEKKAEKERIKAEKKAEKERIKAEKKAEKERKKTEKDNKPKKPRSAYSFFCSDKRAFVKEKNPEKSMCEITTMLGAAWGKIKNEEEHARKYNEMAIKDKERYLREMENFSVTSEVVEDTKDTLSTTSEVVDQVRVAYWDKPEGRKEW